MSDRRARVLAAALVVVVAGCAQTSPGTETAAPDERSASTSPSEPDGSFPTAAFAEISEAPISEEVAAEFQATLREMAGGSGMAATVMSADGTWRGAVGKADGVRDVRVNDQFALASVSKSVIAAQVMQMVEAGELALDHPAADHLPPGLDFDTNGATIRHLLGMRSGIPDYNTDALWKSLSTDRQRVWKQAELLALVGDAHAPPGVEFNYSSTNYLLLGLIIEQVRGRPVVDVLRDGVLGIDGVERLIYQPDEVPTEPMAMPDGESTAALRKGGGYLPSLASVTSGPFGAMASDAPSLARWWRAFCAGEIVSQATVTEMATFDDGDGYGLGLYGIANPYPRSIGHTGEDVGYVAWAGCLPDAGAVVVVLSNRVVEDIGEMGRPLAIAASSDR